MNDYLTNITLIQRIHNRMDESSWQEFTETYSPYIKPILYHFNIPHDQADDLSQDIFLKVWKSIESFEYRPEKCKFRTWLSTVCRNTIFDYFKKMKASSVNIDEITLPGSAPEVDAIIEREWKLYIANKALVNLRAKFEDNVIEAYLQFNNDVPVATVARALGIAENTVYVYNKRVKAAMSREIIMLTHYLE